MPERVLAILSVIVVCAAAGCESENDLHNRIVHAQQTEARDHVRDSALERDHATNAAEVDGCCVSGDFGSIDDDDILGKRAPNVLDSNFQAGSGD